VECQLVRHRISTASSCTFYGGPTHSPFRTWSHIIKNSVNNTSGTMCEQWDCPSPHESIGDSLHFATEVPTAIELEERKSSSEMDSTPWGARQRGPSPVTAPAVGTAFPESRRSRAWVSAVTDGRLTGPSSRIGDVAQAQPTAVRATCKGERTASGSSRKVPKRRDVPRISGLNAFSLSAHWRRVDQK